MKISDTEFNDLYNCYEEYYIYDRKDPRQFFDKCLRYCNHFLMTKAS